MNVPTWITSISPSLKNGIEGLADGTLAAVLPAGLLLVIAGAADVFARRWLTAGQRCAIWSLVLLRLVLPWTPASSISLSYLPLAFATRSESPDMVVTTTIVQAPVPTADELPKPTRPAAPPAAPFLTRAWNAISFGLVSIWIAGLVVLPVRAVLSAWRLHRSIRQSAVPLDGALQSLWKSCCERATLRRAIPAYQFDGVQQPAVTGVVFPKLLLPSHALELEPDQLEMVMLHEAAHVRRQDLLSNWFLLAVQTLHWWNPLAWIAAARYSTLREQACDEFVMQIIARDRRRSYGELLLQLAEAAPRSLGWRISPSIGLLTIIPAFAQHRRLRSRLTALGRHSQVPSRRRTRAFACCLALVGTAGLTSAEPTPPPDQNSPATVPSVTPEVDSKSPTNDGTTVVVYPGGDLITDEENLQKQVDEIREAMLLCEKSIEQTTHDATDPGAPLEATPQRRMPVLWHEGTRAFVVKATREQHNRIHKMFEARREMAKPIAIKCQFLTAGEKVATAVGIVWDSEKFIQSETNEIFSGTTKSADRPEPSRFHPLTRTARINQQTLQKFQQVAERDPKYRLQFAPTITLRNGSQGSIETSGSRQFTTDFVSDQNGAIKPVIDNVNEGITFTALPVRSADGTKFRLEGSLQSTVVAQVNSVPKRIDTITLPTKPPVIRKQSLTYRAEIAKSESLLISIPGDKHGEPCTYVIVTPSDVVEETTVSK